MSETLAYLVLACLLIAAVLLRLCGKAGAASIARAASLFLVCAASAAMADYLSAAGAVAAPLRWAAIFGAGLAAIRLGAIALFWVILPAIRVRSAKIVEDVSLAGASVVWLFVWLRANNVEVTGLIATSAVVTAVLGFSLQDTLGNILGGMAIQCDQSVRVGDWIRVDDVVGRVKEVRWRYTAIETRNWETAVIPNGTLVKNRFLVLGQRQDQPVQWRRWIWFNVDFRFGPTRVVDCVQRALVEAEIPRVAVNPAPQCVLMDFTESCARYAVRYWLTDLSADDATDSEVRTHIYFALERAGIPLAIPAQAVFVTEETAERKVRKEEQTLARRLASLRHVELFRGLDQAELEEVARRLVPAPFTAGDVMTRQGAEAHWLYVIVDGRAEILLRDADGRQSRVAELDPGSFFGEMALMTGEPRAATVIARTDVDCFRLDKESFQEIIHRRPAMLDDISRVLASRRAGLEAALENMDAEARAEKLDNAHRDILSRVRRFFNLEG